MDTCVVLCQRYRTKVREIADHRRMNVANVSIVRQLLFRVRRAWRNGSLIVIGSVLAAEIA